jgi:hypothetical protein
MWSAVAGFTITPTRASLHMCKQNDLHPTMPDGLAQ